jgi:hypothetical protein
MDRRPTPEPIRNEGTSSPAPGARPARSPQPPVPPPGAGCRRWPALARWANGLATAALVAALLVAVALTLRGPGGRGLGGAGTSPTQPTAASACEGTLQPVQPATPPQTPIQATPTGREAERFIACTFEQDPGLRRADELGLVQRPNLAQTVNGFTLTVERVYADASRIVIGYTIRGADWLNDDQRLDHRPHNGLALTDSAGRVHQKNNLFPVMYGVGGRARLGAFIASFDMPSLPSDSQEETFVLKVAESPIITYPRPSQPSPPPPVATTIYNEQGTPTGQRVMAVPMTPPAVVGTAGPWEIGFTVPIARARVAEVNQTVVSGVTASYAQGSDPERPVERCPTCPAAPAAGVAIALERVVVTPAETRAYLRVTAPELGERGGGWELRGIGIEDPASPPQPRQWDRQRQADGGYVVSFTSPLYDKPSGEWTLTVRELYGVLPPDPNDRSGRGGVIVRLTSEWTFRFAMP